MSRQQHLPIRPPCLPFWPCRPNSPSSAWSTTASLIGSPFQIPLRLRYPPSMPSTILWSILCKKIFFSLPQSVAWVPLLLPPPSPPSSQSSHPPTCPLHLLPKPSIRRNYEALPPRIFPAIPEAARHNQLPNGRSRPYLREERNANIDLNVRLVLFPECVLDYFWVVLGLRPDNFTEICRSPYFRKDLSEAQKAHLGSLPRPIIVKCQSLDIKNTVLACNIQVQLNGDAWFFCEDLPPILYRTQLSIHRRLAITPPTAASEDTE